MDGDITFGFQVQRSWSPQAVHFVNGFAQPATPPQLQPRGLFHQAVVQDRVELLRHRFTIDNAHRRHGRVFAVLFLLGLGQGLGHQIDIAHPTERLAQFFVDLPRTHATLAETGVVPRFVLPMGRSRRRGGCSGGCSTGRPC